MSQYSFHNVILCLVVCVYFIIYIYLVRMCYFLECDDQIVGAYFHLLFDVYFLVYLVLFQFVGRVDRKHHRRGVSLHTVQCPIIIIIIIRHHLAVACATS